MLPEDDGITALAPARPYIAPPPRPYVAPAAPQQLPPPPAPLGHAVGVSGLAAPLSGVTPLSAVAPHTLAAGLGGGPAGPAASSYSVQWWSSR